MFHVLYTSMELHRSVQMFWRDRDNSYSSCWLLGLVKCLLALLDATSFFFFLLRLLDFSLTSNSVIRIISVDKSPFIYLFIYLFWRLFWMSNQGIYLFCQIRKRIISRLKQREMQWRGACEVSTCHRVYSRLTPIAEKTRHFCKLYSLEKRDFFQKITRYTSLLFPPVVTQKIKSFSVWMHIYIDWRRELLAPLNRVEFSEIYAGVGLTRCKYLTNNKIRLHERPYIASRHQDELSRLKNICSTETKKNCQSCMDHKQECLDNIVNYVQFWIIALTWSLCRECLFFLPFQLKCGLSRRSFWS